MSEQKLDRSPSHPNEEIDYLIMLRPDKKERIHIYGRSDGSFGRRNFVWIADEYYQGWTVGNDWGHHYDSIATALIEARGRYPWIADYL